MEFFSKNFVNYSFRREKSPEWSDQHKKIRENAILV